MNRIILAIKLLFRTLFSREFADRARKLLEVEAAAPTTPPIAAPAKPTRSEAIGLLAVLQREGRLVDFLKEDLSAYADAQVGAAVRDVHRDCAAAIERMFAVRPLREEPEGAPIDVPARFDAARIRLTGNVAGQQPFRGTLRHAGWQATKLDLPSWSGLPESANIVAPAEVEII